MTEYFKHAAAAAGHAVAQTAAVTAERAEHAVASAASKAAETVQATRRAAGAAADKAAEAASSAESAAASVAGRAAEAAEDTATLVTETAAGAAAGVKPAAQAAAAKAAQEFEPAVTEASTVPTCAASGSRFCVRTAYKATTERCCALLWSTLTMPQSGSHRIHFVRETPVFPMVKQDAMRDGVTRRSAASAAPVHPEGTAGHQAARSPCRHRLRATGCRLADWSPELPAGDTEHAPLHDQQSLQDALSHCKVRQRLIVRRRQAFWTLLLLQQALVQKHAARRLNAADYAARWPWPFADKKNLECLRPRRATRLPT